VELNDSTYSYAEIKKLRATDNGLTLLSMALPYSNYE
jgi:hypothetical protein